MSTPTRTRGTSTASRASGLGARYRTYAVAAAGWTTLYVTSKVSFALTGRLGVTGGPEVPASRYAEYGPGGVQAAQWGLVALGVVAMLLLLAPLAPHARAINRWILLVPISALGLVAAGGAAGMLGRALFTGSGGGLFGAYCAVWTVLIALAAVAYYRHTTALITAGGARRPHG